MTTVATELDARPGDLHDHLRESWELWFSIKNAGRGRRAQPGDVPADVEPRPIAFELNAVAMGLNQALQLFGDRRGPARARQAVRRILHQD